MTSRHNHHHSDVNLARTLFTPLPSQPQPSMVPEIMILSQLLADLDEASVDALYKLFVDPTYEYSSNYYHDYRGVETAPSSSPPRRFPARAPPLISAITTLDDPDDCSDYAATARSPSPHLVAARVVSIDDDDQLSSSPRLILHAVESIECAAIKSTHSAPAAPLQQDSDVLQLVVTTYEAPFLEKQARIRGELESAEFQARLSLTRFEANQRAIVESMDQL